MKRIFSFGDKEAEIEKVTKAHFYVEIDEDGDFTISASDDNNPKERVLFFSAKNGIVELYGSLDLTCFEKDDLGRIKVERE